MYDCSRKCQVQSCHLGKFLPTFEWDVSSEGHEQSGKEARNPKLLSNSMILPNLSSPAAFNWAVLLNIVFCFSFAFWLWLFGFSSSLLHSVCLGSFPASFSLLLALCSWLLCQPSPHPPCHGAWAGACSPPWPRGMGQQDPSFSLWALGHSTGCIRSFLCGWLKSSSCTAWFRDLGKRAENEW